MRLKKAAALTLVTAMTASMAAGCGSSSSTADSKAEDTTAAGESTEEKKEEGASDGKKTLSISYGIMMQLLSLPQWQRHLWQPIRM